MKYSASASIALSMVLLSSTSHAGQWRVVDMPWKGSPGALGAGKLDARLVTEDSGDSSRSRDNKTEWSSIQVLVLKRKAAWVQVSACSIVGNMDTNAGQAGASLLADGRRVMVQLIASTSFMTKPRVCILVEHE